jgi:hypothetical protein
VTARRRLTTYGLIDKNHYFALGELRKIENLKFYFPFVFAKDAAHKTKARNSGVV